MSIRTPGFFALCTAARRCRPTGGARNFPADLLIEKVSLWPLIFQQCPAIHRNRRIALLPSALWFARCRLGSSIGRVLLSPGSNSSPRREQWFRRHVRSHPNSAICFKSRTYLSMRQLFACCCCATGRTPRRLPTADATAPRAFVPPLQSLASSRFSLDHWPCAHPSA